MKYIFPEDNPDARLYALNGLGSFYILLNSLIPLSMIITLEISKIYYTRFIENDVELMTINKDDHQLS